jgi:uncharacterized protein (DUF433 family)
MTYEIPLPPFLRDEAAHWAGLQGISLDQFIVWAVAEKIGSLKQVLDDPRFPWVAFRRGASGWPVPVVRGTGIRVQTISCAAEIWKMSVAEIAEAWDLTIEQVQGALAFFNAHRGEIEASLSEEARLEQAHA